MPFIITIKSWTAPESVSEYIQGCRMKSAEEGKHIMLLAIPCNFFFILGDLILTQDVDDNKF